MAFKMAPRGSTSPLRKTLHLKAGVGIGAKRPCLTSTDRSGSADQAQNFAARQLFRPRLSGRRWLYGPRQLGNIARWRFPLRLHVAVDRTHFKSHGSTSASTMHPSCRCDGPRSRSGLPRCLSALSRLASVVLAELAICATDLAEVIGTAIGLNLLFGIPLEIGVIITAADVLLVLYLQNKGFRRVEALIITLLGVIALCFLIQILMAEPKWGEVIRGFAPTTEILRNPDMLYIALGIIGATVMPHNLYLHSGIIQTRDYGHTLPEKREAIRFATLDSTIALTFALLVNASILILAAASFNATGNTTVEDLDKAHALLNPLLGSALAPTLFAIALLCCGLNSTITATMAGQIVMEGFIDIKLKPWLRRAITRFVAIVPAAIVTIMYGSQGTTELLILSQVVLSLQLPFAIIPLVMFTAEKKKMGALVAPRWVTILAAVTAAIIVVLNMKLIYDFFTGVPI